MKAIIMYRTIGVISCQRSVVSLIAESGVDGVADFDEGLELGLVVAVA